MGSILAKISPNGQLSQMFPPKSLYLPERDIPDLTGKVIIVTGGNSGIGYHTVKQLLLKNAKVYLATRSPENFQGAVSRLKEETNGKEPFFLRLDLGDLTSVRKAAEEFLSKEERLDVLFNNAGVMIPPLNLLTKQGYDLQFGTNVLGHYFFTVLLMPDLRRSTAHYKTKARVVNTSSSMHEFAPGKTGISWETLKGDNRDKAIRSLSFSPYWRLYGQSKIGNVFLTSILEQYYHDDVVSSSLHPGGLKTNLQQHVTDWTRIMRNFLYPAHFGAYTQLYAGTSPEGEGMGGKYLIPWARVGKADTRSANAEIRDKLKAWLEEQIKGY